MKPLGIISFLLILCSTVLNATYDDFNDDYLQIDSIKKKKEEFKNILLPKIKIANEEILKERKFIKEFFTHNFLTTNIDRYKLFKLRKLAKKYRIEQLYNEKEYLLKIAPVPESLALAQAATESAWGQSRFTLEANNIYGEWTWTQNGIVPNEREDGASHRIRIFDSLEESIESYMLNINRHDAYGMFRDLRFSFYEKGESFSGFEAASTMQNYSAIGKEYNKILKRLITANEWDE